ncbi:Ser/Thr protein kinase RdoA (MazF antagonist) [Litoreibacter ponti]|uniref:Ser/Thr protein kinase RdoA (MazF antagonist) n=1 Tax=Litoreibacter ponti TaxID=1510457 RepID=A0A2T6BNA8_9RHOB|nr:phosphotransferase [Litoreibacter ponti]PTX57551.1 Ser/Thr protein kinase RdoA (MazF antagonist) [Litoreibacter ponti]
MDDREVMAHAVRAAGAWGGLGAAPRLIRNRENAVFDVTLTNGTRAALRLHRAGYQTTPSIEAELTWCEALAKDGFPCPEPLRTLEGALTDEHAFAPVASLVSWIDADQIGENGVAFAGSVEAHCALYRDVGALLKRLHETTRRLSLEPLPRPKWDINGLVGDRPLWGRFWENPALDDAEKTRLLEARSLADSQLRRLDQEMQLIHADLLQENILARGDALYLIDFDDSGYGFTGYDLGTAMIQHCEIAYFDTLSDALLDGYGADTRMRASLPLFVMLRAMASCGWIMSRCPHDDPRQRFYAERALRCTERFLQTTTSSSS